MNNQIFFFLRVAINRREAESIYLSFHPTYLATHSAQLISDIQSTALPPKALPTEHFLHLCDRFYQSLSDNLPPEVAEVERLVNCLQINHQQHSCISDTLQGNKRSKIHSGLIQTLLYDPKKSLEHLKTSVDRTIVPYFRSPCGSQHGDVNPFEFGVSVYAINRMITERRTQIFNQLKCVSRFQNAFPEYLSQVFSPAIQEKVSGYEFLWRTGIGSNTIHYAHGKSSDQTVISSLPLSGASLRKDSDRMKESGAMKYVPLYLDYDENNMRESNPDDKPLSEPDYAGSIAGVMRETIRGIKRLEYAMLAAVSRSEPFPTKAEIDKWTAEAEAELHALEATSSSKKQGKQHVTGWMKRYTQFGSELRI